MMIRCIALALWLLAGCLKSFSQEKDTLVSGNFSGTIENFAQAVEAQTNYHFFFDLNQFDSFKVDISADKQPLKAVLDKLFFNTNYFAAIHESNIFF